MESPRGVFTFHVRQSECTFPFGVVCVPLGFFEAMFCFHDCLRASVRFFCVRMDEQIQGNICK